MEKVLVFGTKYWFDSFFAKNNNFNGRSIMLCTDIQLHNILPINLDIYIAMIKKDFVHRSLDSLTFFDDFTPKNPLKFSNVLFSR